MRQCPSKNKTIERCHTPAKMWERIPLGKNYATSIKIIDENLQYWPKFYLHKCKQRLTRIHQYLIRMRKLRMSVQPKLVRVHHKSEKRDLVREKKAEKAAKITKAIEQELLARLNDPEVDVYEGIYNFPQKEFKKVVERVGVAQREPGERTLLDGEEEEEGEQELEYEMEQELENALQEDMQTVGQKVSGFLVSCFLLFLTLHQRNWSLMSLLPMMRMMMTLKMVGPHS